MWDIVELSYGAVPVVMRQETGGILNLRGEVTKNQHGGLIRPNEQRPNQVFKVLQDGLITE